MREEFICTIFLLCLFSHRGAYAENVEEPVHVESIIAQSVELEKNLEASAVLVRDSALLKYLTSVTQTLVLPDDKKDVRLVVHVINQPIFNAFATPHGAIYLCSGIIARMDNEAELAAIIAHEMTHVMNRHAVRELEQQKIKARRSAITQISLDFFIGGISKAVAGTVFKAAVTGYSRDLERQADSMGLIRMRAAGYPTIAFRNMFIKLKQHIYEEKISEPYFFSSHPSVAERIKNYYQIAGKDTLAESKGDVKVTAFISKTQSIILNDALNKFARGKYALAKAELIKCFIVDTCQSSAFCLLGDIARFEKRTADDRSPRQWYEKAVLCDPRNGYATREMGLDYFSAGNKDTAARYLSQYLSIDRNAYDRALIGIYMRQCSNGK